MDQLLPWLSPADEVHDLDRIALVEERGVEGGALDDDKIVFDRHAPYVDVERRQQLRDGHGTGQVERIAIQSDRQRPVTRSESVILSQLFHSIAAGGYPPARVSYKDHWMRFNRSSAVQQYRRNRARSRALFDMLPEDVYYSRPIDLRHPIVFYDGHLPGFSFNTLVKKALGRPAIDSRLELLFARGIDPHESREGGAASTQPWPSKDTVQAFVDEADARVIEALTHDDLER